MRVLCVEDESALREDIAEYLRMHAYDVDEAESGDDAIACLNKNTYDLVLCDIKMPKMDGHELLKQVRRENQMAATPFIFLTALNDRDDKIRAHENGCDGYLTKPIDFSVLDAMLKSHIKRQWARAHLYVDAGDCTQQHSLAAIDNALSGPVAEASLELDELQDIAPALSADGLKARITTIQNKLSQHVAELHMFYSAIVMQAKHASARIAPCSVDSVVRAALGECAANHFLTTVRFDSIGAQLKIHVDASMLAQALAGLITHVPHIGMISEVMTLSEGDGFCILTLADEPELLKASEFKIVNATTNLAAFSNVTRHRIIPLCFALQCVLAHNGRLEIHTSPGEKLALRLVLPRPAN